MNATTPDPQQTWNETDSGIFRRMADVAVPSRAEQIATLLTLMPFAQAQVTALDGSASMLSHAAVVNRAYADRARFAAFDLATQAWLPRLEGADCVLSSLTLHHLSGGEKHRLFAQICRRLSPKGAFLIADLVMPQRPEARHLFADTWDRRAAAQAESLAMPQAFQSFEESEWNYYRYPDAMDQPSSLFDQLTWLRNAGFPVVDCFWMQAGHAIYGGYRQALTPHTGILTTENRFERALAAAHQALAADAQWPAGDNSGDKYV